MTTLVEAAVVVWFCPVKGEGATVHLVKRDPKRLRPIVGQVAICTARGKFVPRQAAYQWTRVRVPGRTHCQACWAGILKSNPPGRIDWS